MISKIRGGHKPYAQNISNMEKINLKNGKKHSNIVVPLCGRITYNFFYYVFMVFLYY